MAARLKRPISIGWRPRGCDSRSSTTRPAAGRPGPRLLTGYYAQQVRRDTRCPASPAVAAAERPVVGSALLPEHAPHRSAIARIIRGNGIVDGMPLADRFRSVLLPAGSGAVLQPARSLTRTMSEAARRRTRDSGYYGTTAIADHAIECLRDHAEHHADQPFFHYLAFTAPHFPLHALPEDITRYKRRYLAGLGGRSATARWQRISEMGLVWTRIACRLSRREVGPPYHFPDALKTLGPGEVNRPLPWTESDRRSSEYVSGDQDGHPRGDDRPHGSRNRPRARSASKAMDALDNTLILLLSDNGASAEIMVRDDGHDPTAELRARPPVISAWGRAGRRPPTRRSVATKRGSTKEASPRPSSSIGPKGSGHAANFDATQAT